MAQTVHHHLQHARMGQIERVAAPGIIHQPARIVTDRPVVGTIIKAAPGQTGPHLIALAGMVVDHIKNHLDACGMQAAHGLAEFLQRTVMSGKIMALGREIGERGITPVIAQVSCG